MVVLSAAICTKSGKALMARQFVEMTRIRIEGLLAAFPKLLGSDSKQHTFVETEAVRYVYQPMENLYLLLITNRASNIVEDLETLRLLSKVVPDITGGGLGNGTGTLSEEKISEHCFALIFAFDEVLTAGGYREPINLQQIRTNLEMESHEEKLHLMIKSSKMDAARDQAKDAARAIRERKMESKQGGMAGIGGGSSIVNSADKDYNTAVANSLRDMQNKPKETVDLPSFSTRTAAAKPVKGMSLGAKSAKNQNLEDALVKEDKLAPVISTSKTVAEDNRSNYAAAPVVQNPVMLAMTETVSAQLSRDGVVQSFDIKGQLALTAVDEDAGLCSVQLVNTRNVSMFSFNTHPKINKSLFDSSQLLRLKDITKGFPKNQSVGILRWSYTSTSDDLIPIKINCWPQQEGKNQMNVSIEYTMDQPITLHNVKVKIPLGTTDPVQIVSIDGSYKHIAKEGELIWTIDMIDSSNATGSLEFNITQKNTDAFFPIDVEFCAKELFCSFDVNSVTSAGDSSSNILYGLTKNMSTEEYQFA